jgi:hypothetical protein
MLSIVNIIRKKKLKKMMWRCLKNKIKILLLKNIFYRRRPTPRPTTEEKILQKILELINVYKEDDHLARSYSSWWYKKTQELYPVLGKMRITLFLRVIVTVKQSKR